MIQATKNISIFSIVAWKIIAQKIKTSYILLSSIQISIERLGTKGKIHEFGLKKSHVCHIIQKHTNLFTCALGEGKDVEKS